MSTEYPSRPSEKRKRRKSAFAQNSSAAVAPPRCFGPLTPEDRARRVAELRTVLAAPAFQARLRAGERGEQP